MNLISEISHPKYCEEWCFYKFLLYLVWLELVGVVEMSELPTWYKKVMKDDAASVYVLHPLGLPSSQFTRGQIR
jgi:hypothetical protein